MRFLFYGLAPSLAHALEKNLAETPHLTVFTDDVAILEEHLAVQHVDAAMFYIAPFDAEDLNALATAKQLRRDGCRVPLIYLGSPKTAEESARWLDTADDVIREPAEIRDVIARLMAVARRGNGAASNTLRFGNVEIDTAIGQVTVDGNRVHLSRRPYQVLQALASRSGMLLSKAVLLDMVYGGLDAPGAEIIDVFVCKIRRALADAGAPEDFIRTVWGRGYLIDKPGYASAAASGLVAEMLVPA